MEVNMNKDDSKNMKSCWWNSHLNPENSEWLAENSKEMNQNVKQIMKLVENNIEEHYQIKSEVFVQVQELRRIYQSLAERYDHLTGELRKSVSSGFLTQDPDGGLNQDFPMVTPDKKMGIHKSVQQASSCSSGGGSSELSLKEVTESSSFSSDSESESFSSSINIYLTSVMDADNGVEHHKVIEQGSELPKMKEKIQADDEENADGNSNMGGNRSYEELNERLVKCEEELRNSNLKLQIAEEEIIRLNAELKKSESVSVLAENMAVQLESLERDIKMREADIELEKGKTLELQTHIVELETYVSNSNTKALRLMEELAGSKEKIKASEEEIAMLKHVAQEEIATLKAQLDIERRQVVNLQGQTLRYKNDLSNLGHEVEELKGALCDVQDNFSMQKVSFQSESFGLLEKETLLEARLKEWELNGRTLEEKIKQCETKKMEMKDLYDAQETMLQGQISQLRAELNDKGVHLEALNKDFDKLKNVRPREGDWICPDPTCGNLNFARREFCNNCKRFRYAPVGSPRGGYPGPPPSHAPPRRFPIDLSPTRRNTPPRGWARDGPRDFRPAGPPPHRHEGRFFDHSMHRDRLDYIDNDYKGRGRFDRPMPMDWGHRDHGRDNIFNSRKGYERRPPSPPPLPPPQLAPRDRPRDVRERSMSPIRVALPPRELRRDMYLERGRKDVRGVGRDRMGDPF